MAKDSGCGGCGSDSIKNNKDKEACPGSEKKPAPSPCKSSKGKGKCHESHEDFKKKGNDCGKGKEDKCGSGGSSGSPCGGSSKSECSDSYKKFQESLLDDCSNSRQQREVPEPEQICIESRPKSVPCSAQTRPEPCSAQTKQDPCSAQTRPEPCPSAKVAKCRPKSAPCSTQAKPESCSGGQKTKRDCQSNIRRGPCSGSTEPEKKESPCSSKQGRPEDGSLYSKITSRCKNMAKDFVKPKRNCSGVDESLEGSMCHQPAPPASLPCPPKTEKGVGYGPPCCTSRVTCSESKASSWADFFPLDARNQKLNACIEKYSKLDPGKVVSQCSQFVNKVQDTSERCGKQARKVQQQCLQGVKGTPAAVKRAAAAPQTLLSTRQRALISRWAPSAGLYLATSALITLYLTEWKAVPGVYTDIPDDPDKEAKPS